MRISILAIAALALLLTGCAGPVDPTVPEQTSAPGTLDDGAERIPAVELIGVWKVSNAAGEGEDTYLRLAEEVMVWNDCGIASGSWAARNDAFIASFDSWSGDSCAFSGDFPAEWVTHAAGYGLVDGELALLDSSGARLATLTKDGKPRTDPNMVDDYREQPELDDLIFRPFEDAVPLPSEAVPAESIVGRWLPTDYSGSGPFVEFSDDGTYSGSDGCNGVGGRWVAGAAGDLLTTSGASTAIGCEGSGAAYAVGQADLVGMVGDELVLYDSEGKKLAALVRE